MNNQLTRFEALAERLVEGTFARLFAGHLHPLEVATHLARAMEDQCSSAADGTPLAPTRFWIYLHPQDFEALLNDRPSLADDLIGYVSQLAREAGLVLPSTPLISVEPLEEVPPHSVRVEARQVLSDGEETEGTREMTDEEQRTVQAAADEEPRRHPFLIVDGERHMELNEPVISLGRALDNDVILEDRRVSRHHAQLRRRYGRYILYDLGSSGGTTINGYPVHECVLEPGDVLSLAGVEMIYGEDPTESADLEDGDTSALTAENPASGED